MRTLSITSQGVALVLGLSMLGLSSASGAEQKPEQLEFFEKKIRPLLVSRCYACHSADTKPAGGLRVDDINGLLNGGDSGPAVVPGNPEKSVMVQRIQHENPRRRMPKEGQLLTKAEIGDVTAWIKDGAAWPAEKLPDSIGKGRPFYESLRQRHWAFKPVSNPPVPPVVKTSWPFGDIDRFILSKLEEKKLTPVGDSDRTTLIRRLTFDLTGLPPTPEEIDSFSKDKSTNAYERLVDRLLQSPRFGERWGRHWLDVARYGESTGPSRNIPYPHAWRYRDYVIDAINRDVPFDRFLQEQIAGDLLPAANTAERDRLQIATGFLSLGPKDVNQRFKERFQMDNVDEKIDTVTRSALALTVSCARCHDHKFDPIPTADYYALAGIFTSTEDGAGVRSKMGGAGLDYYDNKGLITLASYVPKTPGDRVAKLQVEVEAAKAEWEAIRGTPEGLALGPNGRPKQQPFRLKYERLQSELFSLTDPATYGYAIHGVREGKIIADTAIRIRGQAERIGPTVPRGVLTAFEIPSSPKINPAQSGRLELAQWLTSADNPLTPRVMVNRAWKHLFGSGLVTTVDNFGATGDRPSHPELLDYLAGQFVKDGWSVKRLVRRVVLTRAYRLSSEAPATHVQIDPANGLIWRHAPRRLEAEELRDAMLASAGRLDLQPVQGSPARELKMIEMRDDGPESRTINELAERSVHRSIYLPLLRGVTPRSLEAFDPVTQTLVTGQREVTTVPTQALFMLNAAFVRRQALSLAESLLSRENEPDRNSIRQAYRLTLGRTPLPAEVLRAHNFIGSYQKLYAEVAPQAEPETVALSKPEAPTQAIPADPDNLERQNYVPVEETVHAKNAKSAAWMSFVQALYASAEFRFVR